MNIKTTDRGYFVVQKKRYRSKPYEDRSYTNWAEFCSNYKIEHSEANQVSLSKRLRKYIAETGLTRKEIFTDKTNTEKFYAYVIKPVRATRQPNYVIVPPNWISYKEAKDLCGVWLVNTFIKIATDKGITRYSQCYLDRKQVEEFARELEERRRLLGK